MPRLSATVIPTSKFDWMLGDLIIDKLSSFLNTMGLILNSRSFNYSMPKERSSGVGHVH